MRASLKSCCRCGDVGRAPLVSTTFSRIDFAQGERIGLLFLQLFPNFPRGILAVFSGDAIARPAVVLSACRSSVASFLSRQVPLNSSSLDLRKPMRHSTGVRVKSSTAFPRSLPRCACAAPRPFRLAKASANESGYGITRPHSGKASSHERSPSRPHEAVSQHRKEHKMATIGTFTKQENGFQEQSRPSPSRPRSRSRRSKKAAKKPRTFASMRATPKSAQPGRAPTRATTPTSQSNSMIPALRLPSSPV